MKEWARAFYHSGPWKKLAAFVRRRDKGLCQPHLRRGELVTGRIVHHKIPLTPENINDPTISLDPDKCELVCKECHEDEHRKLGYGALNGTPAKPRVAFDANGNVVELQG